MTVSKWIIFIIIGMYGCGKVQQMQDSVSNMLVSNDVRSVEVLEGKAMRANTSGQHYLEYGQVQYKMGTLNPDSQQVWNTLPLNQPTDVYFRGQFTKRSGFEPNVNQEYDVVDIDLLRLK